MSNYYSDIKFNVDNSITIMNHKITMDELVEQSYFTIKYSVAKCNDLFSYITNENNEKLVEFNIIINKHDIIKPLNDRITVVNPKLKNIYIPIISCLCFSPSSCGSIYHHNINLVNKQCPKFDLNLNSNRNDIQELYVKI